jgi:uncharacterized protein YfdQ (DUF2303 family)
MSQAINIVIREINQKKNQEASFEQMGQTHRENEKRRETEVTMKTRFTLRRSPYFYEKKKRWK